MAGDSGNTSIPQSHFKVPSVTLGSLLTSCLRQQDNEEKSSWGWG